MPKYFWIKICFKTYEILTHSKTISNIYTNIGSYATYNFLIILNFTYFPDNISLNFLKLLKYLLIFLEKEKISLDYITFLFIFIGYEVVEDENQYLSTADTTGSVRLLKLPPNLQDIGLTEREDTEVSENG